MKKFVCLMLALMLVLAPMALAESTPSKTTDDMIQVVVKLDYVHEDCVLDLFPAPETDALYEEKTELCAKELEKLASAADTNKYFGEITDEEGNVISMTEMLGVEAVSVYEFFPLGAIACDDLHEEVIVDVECPTPFEKGTKVGVLIGHVETDAAGEQVINWFGFEGTVIEEGIVEFVIHHDTVITISEGISLMAIVAA